MPSDSAPFHGFHDRQDDTCDAGNRGTHRKHRRCRSHSSRDGPHHALGNAGTGLRADHRSFGAGQCAFHAFRNARHRAVGRFHAVCDARYRTFGSVDRACGRPAHLLHAALHRAVRRGFRAVRDALRSIRRLPGSFVAQLAQSLGDLLRFVQCVFRLIDDVPGGNPVRVVRNRHIAGRAGISLKAARLLERRVEVSHLRRHHLMQIGVRLGIVCQHHDVLLQRGHRCSDIAQLVGAACLHVDQRLHQLDHHGGFLLRGIVLRIGEDILIELADVGAGRDVLEARFLQERMLGRIAGRRVLRNEVVQVVGRKYLVDLLGRLVVAGAIEVIERAACRPRFRGAFQRRTEASVILQIGNLLLRREAAAVVLAPVE